MRNEFAKSLTQIAEADSRVVLLMGDIGNKLFDDFKAKFPDRFFNCGVAEGNMMSVAAGLALNGFRPFVYSITPFVTTRCLEQIRVGVCYHNVPVTIVGTGSGLSYADLGPTHHSCEDISFLRSLPGMTVFAPADSLELRSCLNVVIKSDRPAYLRIGKKGEPQIHMTQPSMDSQSAFRMHSVQDAQVAIATTGVIGGSMKQILEMTEKRGVSMDWFSIPQIKPLNLAFFEQLNRQYKLVVILEEHSKIGGLGSAVVETFNDHQLHQAQVLRLGTEDTFLHETGSQEYARGRLGIGPEAIVDKIVSRFRQLGRTTIFSCKEDRGD